MFLSRIRRIAKPASLSHQAGQALIETAIVLALFVVIIVGAVEVGSIAYASIEVTTAAKAAAQYGAQDHATASDTSGMQNAAAAAAPALTDLVTNVNHSCTCANPAETSTCTVGDCPGSVIVETLNITTSAAFTPPIKLPGVPATITLQGQAVQKVLSND